MLLDPEIDAAPGTSLDEVNGLWGRHPNYGAGVSRRPLATWPPRLVKSSRSFSEEIQILLVKPRRHIGAGLVEDGTHMGP